MQWDLELGPGVPGELWPLPTTLGSCDKVMKMQEHRGMTQTLVLTILITNE